MESIRKDSKEAKARATVAEVLAAAAILVALFGSVTSLVVSSRTSDSLDSYKKLASLRRADLHAADVKSCRERHVQVTVFRDYLNVSIRASQKLIDSGAFKELSPQIQQAQKDSLTRGKGFVRNLDRADCTSVPPLRK